MTVSDDNDKNNNSPCYTPSPTISPKNLKQRDSTSLPSHSYNDSSEESVSSNLDLESSRSLLPPCNMARRSIPFENPEKRKASSPPSLYECDLFTKTRCLIFCFIQKTPKFS